ncbi:hypothetical protein C5N14_31260 [Micromonospora sp. MW-13]|nr:hypothetical protein C5N14_31260 [Micromonospora sp. MW-13]
MSLMESVPFSVVPISLAMASTLMALPCTDRALRAAAGPQ